MSRDDIIKKLRRFRGCLPASELLSREEANERRSDAISDDQEASNEGPASEGVDGGPDSDQV